MSTAFGSFITDERESGNSSDADGTNIAENGTSGVTGNIDGNSIVNNRYEYFDPSTATERIEPRNPAPGIAEPRRTKSGKIDRRTKAGRNGYSEETQGSVSPVSRGSGKLVSLEKAILGLHDMASALTGIPELMLSEKEAGDLNDAVLEVSKHYGAVFDPRKVAMFNLATVAAGIYTTRIMAYRHRAYNERKAKLAVMPTPVPQQTPPSQEGKPITIEQYLGGMPPAEGAPGY